MRHLAFTRRGGRSPDRSVAREGSSRSNCRVALATLELLKIPLGGASGGMQGGPRRGRSPITGPALLRAAQASQTPPSGGIMCPKGRKDLSSIMGRNCSASPPKLRRMAEYSDRRTAKSKGSPQLRGESHADVVRARYRMWNQVPEGQKIELS